MVVFVSHAREDRDAAEAIALAVRAAGHEVFFDRDPVALPPGAEYGDRIRRAIERADIFVFCLSPAAIDAGSYTLTGSARSSCGPSRSPRNGASSR